ncbi:type II toxin-antitoxin system RnlB family antitoxin [Dyadobacter fanqingshengii]|uniref:type II toxin-antitoxin system RnlB family antitoxin n=1 Tax=Dyadobacter fanqingshengii TaxID=2906443 RepID=UPI0035B5D856
MSIKKAYNLIKFGNQYLVLSTDYRRFDDYMHALATELGQLRFKGSIVIDLLLSNGSGQSRFFEAYFDGSVISNDSIKKRSNVSSEILRISNIFYTENVGLIQHSVLSQKQATEILSGYL